MTHHSSDSDPCEDQTGEGEKGENKLTLSPFLLFGLWTMMQRDGEHR
jgi:hypothetical protein